MNPGIVVNTPPRPAPDIPPLKRDLNPPWRVNGNCNPNGLRFIPGIPTAAYPNLRNVDGCPL